MATVNPYLNFDSKCEEAFNFYKSVFGGEFLTLSRFSEMPPEHQGSPDEAKLIMHVALPIGQHSILMGSDRPPSFGPGTVGDNTYVAIAPDSREEAEKLFNGLAAGGNVTMPLANAFWGAYFGMLVDKYGIQWMVNYMEGQQ